MVDPKQLIADFASVAALAGVAMPDESIIIETSKAPHVPPTSLPSDKMAVYVFIWQGRCLKIGKVGPKSQARYTSQHYNPNSSKSNLAKSILNNKYDLGLPDLDAATVGIWLKNQTDRIDFLLDQRLGIPILSLLEAFLQCRLRPAFEGFESQK